MSLDPETERIEVLEDRVAGLVDGLRFDLARMEQLDAGKLHLMADAVTVLSYLRTLSAK